MWHGLECVIRRAGQGMPCSLGRSLQEHPWGVKELSRAAEHLGWERCIWDLGFGLAVGRAGVVGWETISG